MSAVHVTIKKEPRHHRQPEVSIRILNVDLSRQRLSTIRICSITEALRSREKGIVGMEGKDYVVKDGDVILFRFNV